MININKIKVYIAEFTSEDQLISLDMFDVSSIVGGYFVGLSIESGNVNDEFSDFERWGSYDLLGIDTIEDPAFTGIIDIIRDYTGIDMDVDEVINTLLDAEEYVGPPGVHVNLDRFCREIYLRSVIYYKNNQTGRDVNIYTLKVKDYDDFHHEFSEDIISSDVLNNNDDYSESIILIETYLTDEEVNNKFKNYIIE